MDGEFVVVDRLTVRKGVAGGNIIIESDSAAGALDAARRASQALAHLPGIITPFPGGVARSGSKVGSRYKALRASTADAYCPTLRGRVATQLHDGVHCAYEIVIDGCDEASVGGPWPPRSAPRPGPGYWRSAPATTVANSASFIFASTTFCRHRSKRRPRRAGAGSAAGCPVSPLAG